MKKKILASMMCAAVGIGAILSLAACNEQNTASTNSTASEATSALSSILEENVAQKVTRVGTSDFTLTLPDNYYKGVIKPEEVAALLVNCLTNDNQELEIDFYERYKGEGETLESFANEVIGENAQKTEINGIEVYRAESDREYEGVTYPVNYIVLEDDNQFVGILVWDTREELQEKLDAILATLTKTNVAKDLAENEIALGNTNFTLTPAKKYVAKPITKEEAENYLANCYYSEESKVDMDVFVWAKYTNQDLKTAAEEAKDEHPEETTLEETTVNGFDSYVLRSRDTFEGETYDVIGYLFEDGDYIISIKFWLDGENAEEEVQSMISTIAKK